jgi:hypothetical protein
VQIIKDALHQGFTTARDAGASRRGCLGMPGMQAISRQCVKLL